MGVFAALISTAALLLTSASFAADRYVFSDNGAGKAEVRTTIIPQFNQPDSVQVDVTVPAVEVERYNLRYKSVTADGLTPSTVVGAPELSGGGTVIAVPPGFKAELQVTRGQQFYIDNVVVKPAQQYYRCGNNKSLLGPLAVNWDIYDSNGVYPKQTVELQELGQVQGIRLMRINLNPLQMNRADNTLRIWPELKAQVNFVPDTQTDSPAHSTSIGRSMEQALRSVVANGSVIQGVGAHGKALVKAEAAPLEVLSPETMIIIASDTLKPYLTPLVEWKQSKGIRTEVYSITEVGGTAASAKEFLQDYYDTHDPKPSYLLLVGNSRGVPTFSKSTSSGSAASDLPYAQLSGSDSLPDMLVGRLVADTASELERQIRRTISYEKSALSTDGWYSVGTTIASNEQGSGPSDVEYAQTIKDSMTSHTYTAVDSFKQGSNNATPNNIIQALDEGRSWLTYIGHGSGTSWASTNGSFGVSSVGRLNNAGKLPIIIDVACDNGSFVRIANCFGKAWVNHLVNGNDAGAVAYYGASVSISWDEPAVMAIGIAKKHFEQPVQTLGGSLLAGQMYLIEQMGLTSQTEDNLEWYNLFGDPSLLVRTKAPETPAVSYSLLNARDVRNQLVEVQVNNAAGAATPGALVSIADATSGEITSTGRTNADGRLTLTWDSASTGRLTVTGYNLQTYQSELR